MTVVAPDIQLKASWLTTIGAICDRFSGEVQTGPFGSQLHAADYSDTGTPVVMPQDMVAGSIVTDRIARVGQEHVDRLGTHVMRTGDIVLSRRGDVARFAVVTDRESGWLCGTGCIRIRLNSKDIDVRYVRHYLQQNSVRSWLEHNAKGVTMANLNTGIIRRLPFAYPPITEQHRIAAILDQADALRAKRREALAELGGLAQAIFVEMFGNHEAQAWPLKNISDVLDEANGSIRTGPFGSQLLHSEFVSEGIAVLGIDNAVSNTFRWGERRHITEEKYQQLRRYTVKPGDVLITIMGTCGRCAVVPDDIPLAINTKHLCCITLDRTKCLPVYLHAYFLMHPASRKYLESTAKGAIMAGLNMGLIKDMPLVLPPLELQKIFVTRFQALESLKATHRTALTELDALFASLQHRAFRGEL